MIKLTRAQIDALNTANLSAIVIADSYTDFTTMKSLGRDGFNQALPLVGFPGTWDTYLAAGNLQDLPRFIEFLKTSPVLVAALKAGQGNQQIRKLVFELIGWIQNGVGEKSPNTILACWTELINASKGGIKAAVAADAITEWNKAIDDCMMLPGFKL